MRHLGDITKINWFEVEPVDCVTGGSPCQDLSVAGKRAGLAGERSGLYMEQIRCIKELRQRDIQRGRTGAVVRPRFMVWENVPGAFSSNGGKDFAAVLEEAVKIVEPQAPPIPMPDKGWPSAGCLSDMDGKWSIAWRVHDAQFWGVPQRRRRIALVCDFGGMSAPEVLFERKGLSGDTEQSGTKREEIARTAGNGIEGASGFTNRGYFTGDIAETLRSDPHGAYPHVCAIDTYNHSITGDVACSLTAVGAGDPTKSGPSVLCLNDQGSSIMSVSEDVSGSLRVQEHGHQPIVAGFKGGQGTGNDQTIFAATPINLMVATRCKALGRGTGFGVGEPGDPANTISAAHSHGVFATAIPINDKATRWQGGGESRNHDGSGNDQTIFCLQGNGIDRADTAGCNGKGWRENVSYTLNTIDRPAVCAGMRCLTPWDSQSQRVYDENGVSPTLSSRENSGLNREAVLCAGFKLGNGEQSRSIGYEEELSPTLNAECGGNKPAVMSVAYGIGNGQAHEAMTMAQEVSQTLNTMHDKQAILYQPKSAMEENWAESKIKNAIRAGESKVSHAVMCEDVSHTLRAKANCAYREDTETYPVQNMMVRRLTPLECERLQGYPDGWTDIGEWIDSKGKKHKAADSPRYKALGNSIALPFWFWLLRRISAQYERPATLGSLFDGIGGFPLCWERCNGKGTALWASEIEEFPMAVTKKRFGEG